MPKIEYEYTTYRRSVDWQSDYCQELILFLTHQKEKGKPTFGIEISIDHMEDIVRVRFPKKLANKIRMAKKKWGGRFNVFGVIGD